MAEPTPLPDLLERAGRIFSLAGRLGASFHDHRPPGTANIDPSLWDREHAALFREIWGGLVELRDAIRNPPDGFAYVAAQLKEAITIAKVIQATQKSRPHLADYLDCYPTLNSIAHHGGIAIKDAEKANPPEDPFEFMNEPTLSLLERYPATPDGHIAFLEVISQEIHSAAEATRLQVERRYSNTLISNMIGGIKWSEARARCAELSVLPESMRAKIDGMLQQELTPASIIWIDSEFSQAIRYIRENRWIAFPARETADLVPAETIPPRFDTTPKVPKPLFSMVEAAAKAIPNVLANVPATGAGEVELVASHLVYRLRQAGHPLAAAEWAVHDTVLVGRLRAERIGTRPPIGRRFGDRTQSSVRRIAPPVVPKRYPVTFEEFKVIATAALWAWWHSLPTNAPPAAVLPSQMAPPTERPPIGPQPPDPPVPATKPKQSTANGEAEVKLVSVLTAWHQYENGGCLKFEPIGNNALARAAEVSTGAASKFFRDQFGGHTAYRALCQVRPRLAEKLRELNGESPRRGLLDPHSVDDLFEESDE